MRFNLHFPLKNYPNSKTFSSAHWIWISKKYRFELDLMVHRSMGRTHWNVFLNMDLGGGEISQWFCVLVSNLTSDGSRRSWSGCLDNIQTTCVLSIPSASTSCSKCNHLVYQRTCYVLWGELAITEKSQIFTILIQLNSVLFHPRNKIFVFC